MSLLSFYNEVNKLRDQVPVENEEWYLVSTKWWKLFSENSNEDLPVPPIDNEDIISIDRPIVPDQNNDGENGAIQRLNEGNHFVLIPKEGWDLIYQKYVYIN